MKILNRNFTVCASALVAMWRIAAAEPGSTEASTNGVLTIEQVLRDVLQNNPSLKAAWANWEAMKQRVPQARAWEDLRSGFDTVAGRFVSIPPNSFTDQKLMVEQAVPLSGKNLLRGEAAEAEAMGALADLHRRELDMVARGRTLFYRLGNAYEQLKINQGNTELLERFVEISRAKYEAGSKPESDVLIAETDLSKLHETRADILRQISDAESQLNVVMNRRAQSSLAHPSALTLPRSDALTLPLELEPLQSLALTNRPELLTARKKIEAAEAKLGAARREWVPDPSLRLEASRYNDASQPASEVMAGVSINLPWFNRRKYTAAIEEAKDMKAAAEYELESAG